MAPSPPVLVEGEGEGEGVDGVEGKGEGKSAFERAESAVHE